MISDCIGLLKMSNQINSASWYYMINVAEQQKGELLYLIKHLQIQIFPVKFLCECCKFFIIIIVVAHFGNGGRVEFRAFYNDLQTHLSNISH